MYGKDIPLPTRAETRWSMVGQGPRLGFVAESGRFVTMNALSTISCFCALLPTFVLFSFLIPACSYLLRVPSSGQQQSSAAVLSASTLPTFFYSTRSFLCHLYPASSRESLCFFIRSAFLPRFACLGWRFICCALVPGTPALDLPTWIL